VTGTVRVTQSFERVRVNNFERGKEGIVNYSECAYSCF